MNNPNRILDLALADDIPNITPSFDSPVASSITTLLSWGLGIALLLAFLGLLISVVVFIFAKVGGNRGAADGSIKGMIIAGVGIAILGSITGIFAWAAGFDLGF